MALQGELLPRVALLHYPGQAFSLPVHCISRLGEWSRLTRQVLGQNGKSFF